MSKQLEEKIAVLQRRTSLYDEIKYARYGTIKEGTVTAITLRGVNIVNEQEGQEFVKWANVINTFC